jgi:PAS domain S-box-containing protein
MFLDITQRKRAAAQLGESERRYRGLFENAQDGFLVLDESLHVVDANPAACDKLEYTAAELRERRLDQLVLGHGEAPAVLPDEIFAGDSGRGDCRLATRSGQILDVEFRAVAGVLPGLHLLSIHDITQRKKAEERARQAQRLAAIGETMAALVHESRNALQRSQACLEMLAVEVEDRPEALDLVRRARRAQHDLHQLYEDVRQWAAPLQPRREVYDVAVLWRDVWRQIVESRSSPTPRLREEIHGDTLCLIDRFLMAQVLRNIFENAWDVSPEEGTVLVRCWTSTLDSGEQFCIAIADQGPGLSAEQQVRIFEPFFTTKAKGTGLGMAIVQRIVHSHEGTIEATSPRGAQIEITLPRGRT